jgi:hypothetical protein
MSRTALAGLFILSSVLVSVVSCSPKDAAPRPKEVALTSDERRAVELAEKYVASSGYTGEPLGPEAVGGMDKRKQEILAKVRQNTLKPRAFGVARAPGQDNRWLVVFEFTDRAMTGELSRTDVGQAVAVDLGHADVQLVDKAFVLAAVEKRLPPEPSDARTP